MIVIGKSIFEHIRDVHLYVALVPLLDLMDIQFFAYKLMSTVEIQAC